MIVRSGRSGRRAWWRRAPGQRGELGVQARLVALDQEGDKLQRVRAALPCEVLVTAAAHPLFGSRLTAYAFRHVDGVLHLKVKLPEGRPGLVRADVTDVHGDGEERPSLVLDVAGLRGLRVLGGRPRGGVGGAGGRERPSLVLDVAGLRELRVLVVRLRDGMAGSGELAKGTW